MLDMDALQFLPPNNLPMYDIELGIPTYAYIILIFLNFKKYRETRDASEIYMELHTMLVALRSELIEAGRASLCMPCSVLIYCICFYLANVVSCTQVSEVVRIAEIGRVAVYIC